MDPHDEVQDLSAFFPERVNVLTDAEKAMLATSGQPRREGWFPDPLRPGAIRFWSEDLGQWTGRTRRQDDSTAGPTEALPHAIPVRESMIVTTETIPGFEITDVLGIVTELSANSGFTATTKGNNALFDALYRLRRSAGAVGANAIVGITGGPFGARGGITSPLGGDAVGILLLGTAVIARRHVARQGEPAVAETTNEAGGVG